ncbi:exonuclease SbcCD subunit D [Nesterenkonia ebinurensis]|uniref:exonuclease SbcCD subunit D n=1 Tax=Nesterenkonia ebinurensis TaxID=2608252 RepID=UPI00123DD605|nr:exonuclease SbcCD subunit D [Nesterenkonia ebinurensis]
MKLLHTSDWHLGRGFHGTDLRQSQQEMIRVICAAVQEHQVDVVLVSGDVFDRALPPEWAVRELSSCLRSLREAGATVVVTSGNHDSAVRLGANRELIAAAGVHIRSGLEEAWTPVEIDRDGERLLVYGVPYLEPQVYAAELGMERASHTAVMTEVIGRIRADLSQRDGARFSRAKTRAGSEPSEAIENPGSGSANDAPPRVVVMAHLFAAHGQASESERSIGAPAVPEQTLEHHEESVGGLAVVPLELFEGFDYAALGHLHGRQRLTDRIRYSGSPIRYSFSEENQHKGAWLVDTQLLDDPEAAVTGLDWSIGRPVKRLRGTIAEILEPGTVEAFCEHFVQVVLTDDQNPVRAYQRLRKVYPHLMQYSYAGAGLTQQAGSYAQKLHEAQSELDVVAGFLEHVRNRKPTDEELQTVEAALEAVRSAPALTGERA